MVRVGDSANFGKRGSSPLTCDMNNAFPGMYIITSAFSLAVPIGYWGSLFTFCR